MGEAIVRLLKPAAILVACAAGTPGFGYQGALDNGAVRKAAAAGRDLAETAGQGYTVENYLLWDRDKPLHLSPDSPLIDAVIVSTPREQVRYQAYFMAFQNKDWPAQKARAFADAAGGTLDFRVFAHAPSGGPEDRDFLTRFGEAKLSFDGGEVLTSQVEDTSTPATDFYVMEDGRHVFRWLGTATYSFDLSDLPDGPGGAAGRAPTLTFTDPAGQAHSYTVRLDDYR